MRLANPLTPKASHRSLGSATKLPYITMIGRGQTTFGDPVLRSEQFALDALDGVSSFPIGTFMVDEGVSGRVELMRPFDWRTQDIAITLIPYVFAATGKGNLKMPTVVKPSSIRASSIGVGLRSGLDQLGNFNGLSVAIEYGKQYSVFRGWQSAIGRP